MRSPGGIGARPPWLPCDRFPVLAPGAHAISCCSLRRSAAREAALRVVIEVNPMNRKLMPAVVAAAIAILALAAFPAVSDDKKASNKPKKSKGGHPAYVFTDSSFAPAGANRVMIIAFLNTTSTAQAEQKFIPLLEEAVRGKTAALTFVDEPATAGEAQRRGLTTDYQTLRQQWEASRSFEPTTLIRFADSLNAQYVMGGDVSEWSSTAVDWNVEGYSHSDVQAALKIFDGATGKLVWEARDKVELKSALHDPHGQSSGVVDDIGIQRGGRQTVPAPPPIDEAARQVAKNLAGALP